MAFRAFGSISIGGRVNVSRRRRAAVVGDGNGRRFAGVTVAIGDGVLHRFRVAAEGRLWREGHFAARRIDFPFAFARDFQGRHRLVGRRIDQFDALRIEGVVALRVAVVGKDVHFDRLAFRAFGSISIGGRVNATWLRLRIWTRIRVRAWARTGIGVRIGVGLRVRVGRRRGVVVVCDNGGFHAAVAAVAVLRGHA